MKVFMVGLCELYSRYSNRGAVYENNEIC